MARQFGVLIVAACLAIAGCDDVNGEAPLETPSGQASFDQRPARYELTFGKRGRSNSGMVEFTSDDRACLILRAALPKAAHLHFRARGPGSNGILVTFFEPPTKPRPRSCVSDSDPRDARYVEDHTPRVYVDLHYSSTDEGVLGTLTRRV